MQGRVTFDALSVHVGSETQQVLRDLVMAFVARDHQTGVSVPVGHLDIYEKEENKSSDSIDISKSTGITPLKLLIRTLYNAEDTH